MTQLKRKNRLKKKRRLSINKKRKRKKERKTGELNKLLRIKVKAYLSDYFHLFLIQIFRKEFY